MNTTTQKSYLVIRNCCSNNHLRSYLEQICHEEKVNLVEEYVSSNWLVNESRPSLYEEHGAKPSFDALLESYSLEKLRYIEYLYNIYEKQYRYSGNIIMEILEDKIDKSDYTIGEIKIDITDEVQSQFDQWNNDIADSMTKHFQDVYNANSKYIQPHVHCGFRAPDARDYPKVWSNGELTTPQKIKIQSKFKKYKQKVIDFISRKDYELICMSIGFFAGCMLTYIIYSIYLTFK